MSWQTWTQSEIVADLGWTLLHSVWQIALVSVGLFAALRIVRPDANRFRYSMCVAALAISIVLPAATFMRYASEPVSERGRSSTSQPIVAATKSSRLSYPDAYQSSANAGGTAPDAAKASAGYGDILSGLASAIERNSATIMPIAVAVWLFGVTLFGIRLGGGFWQVHRYRFEGVETVDDELAAKFERLKRRLGIDAKIELLKSNIVGTPVAFGVLKPIILLPASVFLQMSPREIELIVAHELTHIKRFDPLVNIFQSFAEVVLFYHPGVWWISGEIRREREFAADNLVTEITGASNAAYAATLVNLEEIRLRANYDTPRLATAADGGKLMQRVKRILQKKTEMRETRSAWPAGVALVLISALVAMAFSISATTNVNADAKKSGRKLAIGFVSLPPVDRTENAPKDSDATARLLIETLKNRRIPATGFVLGGAIVAGDGKEAPIRANIVRLWRDAGFEIGIGGYKHIWFADTPFDSYTKIVEQNETLVRSILDEKGIGMKYFSYPFLNTGQTHEDHVRFEKWLASRGLQSVKYTIDNQEWMYSYAYDMARNDNDLNTMNEIRAEFIKYMGQMFDHFEAYSQKMFGRDIAQTMVLTPSRLVADSSDELFGMIERRGYSYVTMADAQADPAYATPENFAGKAGISWFERWAMYQKMPLLDEPEVSKQVSNTWELRNKRPPLFVPSVVKKQ